MESRFTPGSVPYRILNEIKKDDIDPAQLSLSSTILIATKLLKQVWLDQSSVTMIMDLVAYTRDSSQRPCIP